MTECGHRLREAARFLDSPSQSRRRAKGFTLTEAAEAFGQSEPEPPEKGERLHADSLGSHCVSVCVCVW